MKLSRIVSYAPEAIFLLVSLGALIDRIGTGFFLLNCLLMSFILAMAIMIMRRVKTLAIILSASLTIVSIYMSLAVISEYNEFEAGSTEGQTLLLTGLGLFTCVQVLAVLMPFKYFTTK